MELVFFIQTIEKCKDAFLGVCVHCLEIVPRNSNRCSVCF
ncbi:TPA: hypothetical protein DHW62_02430 [candidate division WWE3 bacterium]|uniref:RING finger protein Z zinc finger domain-containing protein n=1 Tax=candidate division WWE3 bacterium TaxID=2053526 RepID=A0A656PLK5_UNCKA|nr:hypothetical protein [candidate division WWE3 bacterium]HBL00837.1 hypothetical protein [candidate division WWE3 bacterium]HBT66235.1 hypothetical protein [candidate division WWE3 bacterium]HCE36220.1 hypothetical protein [candidate division WWE3 bacterium]HCL95755.1 hypothetical protein [candidate division WWE3 bacterium]